ncbi:hypothetical protein LEMA_P047440.1 [Plenodomus lingam JN3]|uniref:Xylanolytic transcriptional activator regulatory domain-containing protein n=1 Tax=Leptosphaeria maculans (strain JN3 / isolate v23.1.3 / race Av1-4-5-6-7-8) TaxID=985895 RepID=E5R568_LEPMJ|nr:hypothetical protein LEMA_P047440.1 [Plenodomus lingam JN3]CBX92038.1 hypothetical protein LEMA_P047440.1 [Plenodomus lingam JN3]
MLTNLRLKCDRQQPCRTCVDRGLSLSCSYVRPTPTPKEGKAANSVHDRINQLEKLVTSLMGGDGVENKGSASSTPLHANASLHAEVPGTPDRVKFDHDATSYTNSGHWTSILDGVCYKFRYMKLALILLQITELREHLDQVPVADTTEPGSQDDDVPGPKLLFGRHKHATKEELLAALPSRSEANQLVDTFFQCMDIAPSKGTFLRQYHEFWIRPFETSTMWIGMLYAALALGSRFQADFDTQLPEANLNRSEPQSMLYTARMSFYREKVVQCLVLANYLKCPPYTIETCLLYFGTEYFRSVDTQFGMYILAGTINRIAFRMGYHREPSKFPNITPFWAEMRRRNWLIIMSLDFVTSAQVGLPRMIQPFMYDAHEPRNLGEDDIDEHMSELPPSRPETDLTQLLYSIVLTRVRLAHARVMDLMYSTSQPAYREIMEMDKLLRDVYDAIPESAKVMPSTNFDTVVSPETMRRLYLGLAFLKAELMLHRPYLLLGRTDSRYQYSRRICLNAAVEMLGFQSKLDTEIQPGGKLWSAGWQILTVSWYLSSLVAQDFLFATTVLVLDLEEDVAPPLSPSHESRSEGLRLDGEPPSREELIEALRMAHRIWTKASKRSQEARRVAAAAKLVLAKVDAHDTSESTATGQLPAHSTLDHAETATPTSSFDFCHFAAEANSANLFAMANSDYGNPFALADIPMDMGSYTEAFGWVCASETFIAGFSG